MMVLRAIEIIDGKREILSEMMTRVVNKMRRLNEARGYYPPYAPFDIWKNSMTTISNLRFQTANPVWII
jgi:hypothetical protein